MRLHWPDQSGYFDSSSAQAPGAGIISAATSAIEAIELCNIAFLPNFICDWPGESPAGDHDRPANDTPFACACERWPSRPECPCRCGRNGAFWRREMSPGENGPYQGPGGSYEGSGKTSGARSGKRQ